MPTINRSYDPAGGFQSFLPTAPFTGIVRVTNNGAFHVYIRDNTLGQDAAKVTPGTTKDVPVVQGREYLVQVMGDVSIDYTLIPG
jgi:hypothetical protein